MCMLGYTNLSLPNTLVGPGAWTKAILAMFTLLQLTLPESTMRPLYLTLRPWSLSTEPPPNQPPPRKFGRRFSRTMVGGTVHSGLNTMDCMSAEKTGVAYLNRPTTILSE